MQFTVNGEQYSPDGVAEVERIITSCSQTDDLEIWISEDSKTTLCALLNERCGWLMFLRFPEDSGLSSRNPMREQIGSGDETFVLANGQADTYPSSWTFSRAEIFDALLEFVTSGGKPSKVVWHDDALK